MNRTAAIAIASTVTLAAGYCARFYLPGPELGRDISGAALYVVLMALLLSAIRPAWSPVQAAAAAFLITSALEFLQLVHWPWLDALRATRLGRLSLGTTFNWADFPPYAAGAALSVPLLRRLPSSARFGRRV